MTVGAAITIIIQLIFLEGILSIDNAAVLGAMVSHLPKDQPIPWPGTLKNLFHEHAERILGHQQQAALRVGLLGAYLGRGIMLLLATYIIRNPWLRLLGALYLIKIAAEHLGKLAYTNSERLAEDESPKEIQTTVGKGFWSVVLTVELTDLAFSLDNVVAAVALSSDFWVVIVGVAIGILIMRFAAGIFALIVEKRPTLVHAAYLLILAIALELIVADFGHIHIHPLVKFAISLVILLVVWAYSQWLRDTPIREWLMPFWKLMRAVDQAISVILWPLYRAWDILVGAAKRL